jgi:hypothetical protein
MFIIGSEADLGANSPNYAFSLPTIFGIEVLASDIFLYFALIFSNCSLSSGFSKSKRFSMT